jgi:hypothetical protein
MLGGWMNGGDEDDSLILAEAAHQSIVVFDEGFLPGRRLA